MSKALKKQANLSVSLCLFILRKQQPYQLTVKIIVIRSKNNENKEEFLITLYAIFFLGRGLGTAWDKLVDLPSLFPLFILGNLSLSGRIKGAASLDSD